MTTVTISPEAALDEARADDAYHKQRCLILRQALVETEAARAALEKELADLKTQLAEQEALDDMTENTKPKKKGGS